MSSGLTFGTIKRVVAILLAIAVVLAAGIVVGQAPTLFGVEDDPEASIEFDDQQSDGENVTIEEVYLSDGGFIVVTDGSDESLAVSEYLGSGTHEDVTIDRDEDADDELVGQLTATVHQDTTNDEEFVHEESEGEDDQPYLEDGFPVEDSAAVMTTEADDSFSDSFAVESIDAPTSATTDETIEITAEIRNPTEIETQQTVEFRLGGTVLEQRPLELDGGESSEVTFDVETSGSPPGEQPIGVYTEGDGEIETIDLEFHTDPSVDVVDASDERVTADVAIPTEGALVIEDEDGAVVASSEQLDPDEHEDVSADFEDDVDVDDEAELTAVLYDGDPDETGAPLEDEDTGEPIEETFTIAEVEEEADAADDEDDADDGDE